MFLSQFRYPVGRLTDGGIDPCPLDFAIESTTGIRRDADVTLATSANSTDAAEWAVGAGSTVGETGARRLAVDTEAFTAGDGGTDTATARSAGTKGSADTSGAGVEGAGSVGTRAGWTL